MSKGKILKEGEIRSFGMPSFDNRDKGREMDELVPDTEDIERKAYEEGFSAGEKAGYDIGLQKAEVLLESLKKLIEDFTRKKEEVLRSIEPQVVALSIAIARRILKDEIATDPEKIANLVKVSMRRLVQPGQIVIRINPSLSEIFERLRPELLQIGGDIRIEEDPSVALSAPVVSSAEQEIPIDLEAQLTNLIEEMGERIGEYNP